MLGAARELHRQFASVEVNAAVSRQFNDGIRILRARLAAGTLPDVVVIHLGTNGPINKRQFDLAMSALRNVRLVVFVNVKVPRPWESYTNRTLSQNVGRYPNAVLVDWRGNSTGVDGAFAKDGIHLNRAGAQAYARLIARTIN
jgi:lysophospholipase L1-like esterase